MGIGGGGWLVGNFDFKENPKSDLDLDLGFVNWLFIIDLKHSLNLLIKTLAYILLQVGQGLAR